MIKTVLTCPLGSQCEKVVGDAIERCAWYVEMEGMNPQTGERMDPISKCAMAWMPILHVEGNMKTNQVAASVISLRETVSKPPQLVGLEHGY